MHTVFKVGISDHFILILGISNYCERYREGMKLVLNTFGPVPEFSGEIEQKISQVNIEPINAMAFTTENVSLYICIISIYC